MTSKKNIELHPVLIKTSLLITSFYLAAIPGIHACTPQGHITFHNESSYPIKLIITRALKKEVACLTVKKEKWSKKQKKLCSGAINYRHDTINISPENKAKGICQEKNGYRIATTETIFMKDGSEQKGPYMISRHYESNILNTYILSRLHHEGNQKYITSSGCASIAFFSPSVCSVYFRMANKK